MGVIERIRDGQMTIITTIVLAVLFVAGWFIGGWVYRNYFKAPVNQVVTDVNSGDVLAKKKTADLTSQSTTIVSKDKRSKEDTEIALGVLQSKRMALIARMNELKSNKDLKAADMIKRLEEEGFHVEDF